MCKKCQFLLDRPEHGTELAIQELFDKYIVWSEDITPLRWSYWEHPRVQIAMIWFMAGKNRLPSINLTVSTLTPKNIRGIPGGPP